MPTNAWTCETERYKPGRPDVAISPGGASLQACVLVLLFAAAALAERNDCAAYVLGMGDDVRGDGNRAGALYALGHEIEEDQHALWRTPA